jgi:transcriptional regulator with XRE-family HTH domain
VKVKKKQAHLGERIKRLRAFKGLTQQDLAAAIGKTRSLVSYLERTGNINPYTLQEIANALQVNTDQLENLATTDRVLAVADTVLEEPKTVYTPTTEKLLQQLQEEIIFLKDTVNHQWQLLHELAKSK